MNITNIKVSAGRTFNHPYESYSNFKHHVELVATVSGGEDATSAVKALQSQAEQLAEDHKNTLLSSVRTLNEMAEYTREISSLEQTIKQAQERLESARKKIEPSQTLLPIGTQEPPEVQF